MTIAPNTATTSETSNLSGTPDTRVAGGSVAPAPTGLRIGAARLVVADAQRSIAFYGRVLGLAVQRREAHRVELGIDGRTLLTLDVRPGARPKHASETGLYHVAFLLPDRPALGAFLRNATQLGVPLGHGDHLVSEALYLNDPDGNGLEVYRDRPRSQWQHRPDGQLAMGTSSVDLAGVVAAADAAGITWSGASPEGTTIGHVHLQVDELPAARRIYSDVLGLDVMVDMTGMGALFFGADGYHHHIGSNTWSSRRGPAPGQDTATVRTVELTMRAAARDDVETRARRHGVPLRFDDTALELDDPWGVTLRVSAEDDA